MSSTAILVCILHTTTALWPFLAFLGCVIDQFEVDDTYNVAIEVTAEGRLFHHVVTNDRVATALLDYINENQMRGECNFFPLNRLSAKCALQLQEEQVSTLCTTM